MARTLDRRWGWLAGLALVVGLAALPGCAYFAAEYARTQAIERELDAYVIPKPLEEVWPHAKNVNGPYGSLLFSDQGWSWSETGPFKMRTSTREDVTKTSDGRTVTRTWYEAEGAPGKGGCRVRYYKASVETSYRGKERGMITKSRDRQPDLELELVKMFDAKSGKKIEAKGEAAAQKELND